MIDCVVVPFLFATFVRVEIGTYYRCSESDIKLSQESFELNSGSKIILAWSERKRITAYLKCLLSADLI